MRSGSLSSAEAVAQALEGLDARRRRCARGGRTSVCAASSALCCASSSRRRLAPRCAARTATLEPRRVAEYGAEFGGRPQRRHDLRRDGRALPVELEQELLQHLRRLAPGGVLQVEGLAVDDRAVAHAEHLHVGAGVRQESPITSNASRSSTRADWRSCTWRTAASRSRSSAAFSNSCASGGGGHLALDVAARPRRGGRAGSRSPGPRRPGTPRA